MVHQKAAPESSARHQIQLVCQDHLRGLSLLLQLAQLLSQQQQPMWDLCQVLHSLAQQHQAKDAQRDSKDLQSRPAQCNHQAQTGHQNQQPSLGFNSFDPDLPEHQVVFQSWRWWLLHGCRKTEAQVHYLKKKQLETKPVDHRDAKKSSQKTETDPCITAPSIFQAEWLTDFK